MARRAVGTAPTRVDDSVNARVAWSQGRSLSRLSRQGSSLRANGRTVRLAGPNAYWLALNDNVLDNGLPTYPSKTTVDATLDAAVAMGANTVRIHSVGISLGKPRTIMPTLDVYDPVAFDRADYVIAAARARGLWLSVPLTDRWDYYHGGAQSLVNMVMPSGQRQLYRFWSEQTVRDAFDRYVTALLNHVNPYTGLRWGDDPTLAMWEVANEFYDLRNDTTSRARHASAAALIKSLAPRALVVDGTGASGGRTADAPGLTDTNVDILTAHYYNDHSMDTVWLPGDATSAVGASKVFMVGEYDWTDGNNGQTDQNTSVTRAAWLSAIEANTSIAGDYWWTLLVPAAGIHRDKYELYDPPENAEQTAGLAALTTHAVAMRAETAVAAAAVVTTPTTPTGLRSFGGLHPIAGHVTPPSGGSTISDGTQTTVTYFTAHQVTDDASSVALVFSNWYTDGSAEIDGPNPIVVSASVTVSGTLFPLTWNGARTVVVAPGQDSAPTDQAYIEVVPGDILVTRTCVTVMTAGQKWPMGSSTVSPNGSLNSISGSVVGSDATLIASPTPASPGNSAYGPSAILGATLRPRRPIVGIVGASNTYGYGDTDSSLGFIERSLQTNKTPFIKVSKPGEAGFSFAGSIHNRRHRLRYVAGCTHHVLGYGNNDGGTFADLAATHLKIAGLLARLNPGSRTYMMTIPPRSTSTDGWTTTTGQTANNGSFSSASARTDFNDWARAGFPVNSSGIAVTPGTVGSSLSPLFSGVVEIADFVETARNSGIWKANYTADGAHIKVHDLAASVVPTFRLDALDLTSTSIVVTPTPTPAAETGLLAFYDPSTLSALSNGASVASWPDSGPNNYTATQSDSTRRPTYRAVGIGGKPAVQFASQALVSNLSSSTLPFTLIFTHTPTGFGNRTILGASANGGRLVRFSGDSGTSVTLVSQGVAQIAQDGSAASPSAQVVVITYDGTSIELRVNGVTRLPNSVTPQTFTAGLTTNIGARTSDGSTDPYTGMLGDLKQYDRVLSASTLAAEEQRQATKYGITLG